MGDVLVVTVKNNNKNVVISTKVENSKISVI